MNQAAKTKPDFIIIGAMKCATSTLHDQLAAQPGVWVSEPKEPCYFSDDEVFARGEGWYASLFAGAKPGDRCGESSTHYTKLPTYPKTIQRMREAVPHAKLMYVMRDPVERLRSQYVHEWTQKLVSGGIDEALDAFPPLVEYSRYAYQLRPFLETYGPERILPVFFERLKADPQGTLQRVWQFIGGEGQAVWQSDEGPKNVSAERLRKSGLRDAIVYAPGVSWLRRNLVPQSVRDKIKSRWTMQAKPELSEASLARVTQVFNEDLAELGRWFGLELNCANWKDVAATHDPQWRDAPRPQTEHAA